MLKVEDLANRADFAAGPLKISPSRRLIAGPNGTATIEPIVMKVLLVLLDARGSVVTREELFGQAWGGVLVGDDSLNRAIARLRKSGLEIAPEAFEIETIPRTGYRLTGAILKQLDASTAEPDDKHPALSRRTVVGVGAASVAVLAGGGSWLQSRASDNRRFQDLLKRGEEGLEYGSGGPEPLKDLLEARAIRPADPAAQGLLAFAIMGTADNVYKIGSTGSVEAAKQAASISLQANPQNPNARLALIQLERSRLDLAGTEDRLRAVLASAPNNIFAMRLLWNLLQSAGRSGDALALVERAIAIKPLAAGNNFPLAQLLWITNRTAEADRIIDRAINFWPAHPYVRFARFTIFAFTGRARAALAMLEDSERRPQTYSAGAVALWRKSLPVIDKPSRAAIADIRAAYLDAAKGEPKFASQAIMVLSALGEVDYAFEIANELFVFRKTDRASATAPESRGSSTAWRFTPWLFTPPTASMRADPRFVELCNGTGLSDYWREQGVRPDYQLATS